MATSVAPPTAEGSGTYTYSSQPKAVQQRPKFRSQTQYSNIMYDRRIVRGNTYALHTLPASSQPDPLELQRQQESRRRALAKKRARDQLRPHSPEPVEGRKHIEVQTELYLEEITDRIEEADVQTQTDAFLDRPPTPLFVPAKTGVDVATQIEEGDLFNFNLEVKPILEVLVGKTVEQALLEVMEEEELANLRAQQRQFEENRNAEVVETQRLEEQERRHREEKERRMRQQREALLKEKETAEKIAARAFAQSYLSDLVPSVFNTLSEHGFFYDPIEREVETVFMPWLMEEAVKALDKTVLARAIMDVIIHEVVVQRLGVPAPEQQSATEAEPTSQEGTDIPTEPLKKVFGEKDKEEAEAVQTFESTKPPTESAEPPTEATESTEPPTEANENIKSSTESAENTEAPTESAVPPTEESTKPPAESTEPPTEETESAEPSIEAAESTEVPTKDTEPPVSEEPTHPPPMAPTDQAPLLDSTDPTADPSKIPADNIEATQQQPTAEETPAEETDEKQ